MTKKPDRLDDFLNDDDFRHWVLEEKKSDRNLYWSGWAANNPGKADRFRQAIQVLESLRDESVPWTEEREARTLRNIRSAIRKAREARETNIPQTPEWYWLPHVWYKTAAAAVILLFFSLALWQFGRDSHAPAPEIAVSDWVSESNISGQRSEVVLPDGSIVALNAESELRYDRLSFGRDHRDVFLTGEAFFEVRKNPESPFRVHSNDLITIALGTSFNVRAYADLPTRVQLATGRVSVSRDGGSGSPGEAISSEAISSEAITNEVASGEVVFLEPGQEAILGQDEELHVQHIAVSRIDAWRNGILLFDKTPFREAVRTLERWYGVEITVKGLTGGEPVLTGRFENEQLGKTLESMQFSLGFRYTIDRDRVTIEFN